MFDYNALLHFSHTNCISICAFLVPCILLLTLQTIVLTALRQSQTMIKLSAVLVSLCGVAMVLHVVSWFLVGVVMAPTFILLYMAATCLMLNIWAIAHPESMIPLVGELSTK